MALRLGVNVKPFARIQYASSAAAAVATESLDSSRISQRPIPKSNMIPIPSSRSSKLNLVYRKTLADDWNKMTPNGLVNAYLQLSKHRLTMLITSTAIGGFLMSPAAFDLKPFVACTVGTTLLSASANACNHLLEAPYDAQMKRTQSRVLVIHRFSPLNALIFANVTALTGLGILWAGCNPLTAVLGILNIGIYAGIYTPLKRYHIGCTWAGAVVGAIPPLMGYAALTGTIDAAGLVLAAILYSWQFPHFNGLSWNLRSDYSRAGYRVMCVTDEGLCRRTTLRYALALIGLCSAAAPLTNLTTTTFALDSLPLNLAMLYLSYKFYRNPDAKTARNLFRYSLIYLPLLMVFMVISNRGRNADQVKPVVSPLSKHPLSAYPFPGMLTVVPSPVDVNVRPKMTF